MHIPNLRFPEFLDDVEWKSIPVGDVITIIVPPKKLQSSEYKDKGLFPIIDQSFKFISGYSDDSTALLNTQYKDCIVFGDHTCVLKLIKFPFIQGADGIKIFHSKTDMVYTPFLYQYLLAHPIQSNEYKRHFSDLKKIMLYFPSDVREQKEIADSLSSIDHLTQVASKKIKLLEKYKKGLTQQMFPKL